MNDTAAAPSETQLPAEWRIPAALRAIAALFVAGVVAFAGDADVTWSEFRWNLAFGAVAGTAVVLLLFRPRVRVGADGEVTVTNPVATHRFACSDIVSIDWAWLGHRSVRLANDRRIALWAIQQTRRPTNRSVAPSFDEVVELHCPSHPVPPGPHGSGAT